MIIGGIVSATTLKHENMQRFFLRILACTVAVFGLNPAAISSDNPNSTLPCLSGICLGEEIAKYSSSIDWKLPKVEVNLGNSPFSELYSLQERALGIPAGSGKNIYLSGDTADGFTFDFYQKHPSFANFDGAVVIPDTATVRVDGPFIQALASNGVTFCRDVFFRASFDSNSGYPTWVSFRPDAQGKLRITELIRSYPLSSQEEVNATIASLHKEYPFLAGYPLSNSDLRFTQTESDGWFAGPWGGQFKLFQYTNSHELYLAFNYKNVGNSEQLKKNPTCPQRVIRNSID